MENAKALYLYHLRQFATSYINDTEKGMSLIREYCEAAWGNNPEVKVRAEEKFSNAFYGYAENANLTSQMNAHELTKKTTDYISESDWQTAHGEQLMELLSPSPSMVQENQGGQGPIFFNS